MRNAAALRTSHALRATVLQVREDAYLRNAAALRAGRRGSSLARSGVVRAGDSAGGCGEAGVYLEAYGVGARVHESHLGVDALSCRQKSGVGGGAREITSGRNIASGDSVAEAILQGDSQQRHGLRLMCAIFDTCADHDLTGTRRVNRCSELAHIVCVQIPSWREMHTQRRVKRSDGLVELRGGGEVVAIMVHDLRRKKNNESSRARAP